MEAYSWPPTAAGAMLIPTMTPPDISPERVFPPARNRARRLLLWGVLGFFFLVVISPQLVALATDLFWYREIGFERVVTASLTWRVSLFALGGIVTLGFLHANVRVAMSGVNSVPIIVTNARTGERTDLSRFLPRLAFVGTVVIAFIAAVSAS